MKRKYVILIGAALWMASSGACAQEISKDKIEEQIRFLASDKMQGRQTGEEGNNQAADYIRTHFKKAGLKPMPGSDDYYQKIIFQKRYPSEGNTLKINGSDIPENSNMLTVVGLTKQLSGSVVFAKYGIVDPDQGRDDYEGLDVKGKIVVVKLGESEDTPARKALQMLTSKRIRAAKKGAVALIELYRAPAPFTWRAITNYFRRPQTSLLSSDEDSDDEMIYMWLRDDEGSYAKMLDEGQAMTAEINSKGVDIEKFTSQNVVAYVEGTDAKLKEEYIFLTAHYDHIGTGGTAKDTIYNGARDNAIGTVAVMSAATYFAKNPPKRSVAFIAYTAEEMGLLGSSFYADHPLIPMEKAAYNLNIDGGGYNDTSLVTVIGLGRTNADDMIQAACKAYGLKAIADPVPGQGLFDRSDNVSLAAKGVPAPTFSTGLTAFDSEILKYYHQVTDEAESLDFEYLFKYTNAYIKAAESIGNFNEALKWVSGDKYEPAYKRLHQE